MASQAELDDLRLPFAAPVRDFREFWYLGPRFKYLAHASYVNAPFRSETLNINPLGFRGQPISQKKVSNTRRIGFFGASAMLCIPNIADSDTISEATRHAMAKAGETIDVMNFGVMCYLIKHEMNLVTRILAEYEFDAIVLFSGYNDSYVAAQGELWDYQDVGDIFRTAMHPARETVGHPLRLAYRNLKRRMQRLPYIWSGGIEAYLKRGHARSVIDRDPVPLYDHCLPLYRLYLHQLASACRYAGVPLIYVHQPSLWATAKPLSHYEKTAFACLPEWGFDRANRQRRIDAFAEHYRKKHADSLAWAREFGATALDLDEELCRLGDGQSAFYDYCHLTREGVHVFADLLARTLTKKPAA